MDIAGTPIPSNLLLISTGPRNWYSSHSNHVGQKTSPPSSTSGVNSWLSNQITLTHQNRSRRMRSRRMSGLRTDEVGWDYPGNIFSSEFWFSNPTQPKYHVRLISPRHQGDQFFPAWILFNTRRRRKLMKLQYYYKWKMWTCEKNCNPNAGAGLTVAKGRDRWNYLSPIIIVC
jgi:hypothetical protein